MKECPMCGEAMRLDVRATREAIPGQGHSATKLVREWVCPECDHFEEAETGEG
jgi:transposase